MNEYLYPIYTLYILRIYNKTYHAQNLVRDKCVVST